MTEQADLMYERYARDITRFPRISLDRERHLSRLIITSRRARTVDRAVNEMVEANLLLVVHCLKDFARFLEFPNVRITNMDLIAEGNIGLLNAARNFDAERAGGEAGGVRFSTYACKSIKNAMRRALKLSRFIHVPEHHFSYWTRMKALEDEYGHAMEDNALKETLGVNTAKLKMLQQSQESGTTLFEDMSPDSGSGNIYDLIEDEKSENPGVEAERRDLRRFLVEELFHLPLRTRKMLTLIYFDERAMTFSELSGLFGVSKERCRQLCARGLETLRERLVARIDKVLGPEAIGRWADGKESTTSNGRAAVDTMLNNLVTMPKPRRFRTPQVAAAQVNAA